MTELNENNTKFTSLDQWVVAALKAKKLGGSPSFSMSGKSIVVFFGRNLRGEWQTARGYGHLPDTVLEGTELGESKVSVGDRVTLQPNKNTLDRSLIGKAGVVTGMVGSKPTVKFANGKTIVVSPNDLKINESVELDEGAVSVSTVEKDIRKNGGTNIKKDDKFIKFMHKGSERKVAVDKGFVKSDQYMKLQDMLETTLHEAKESGMDVVRRIVKNKSHEKGVDMQTANAILQIYGKVNDINKKKMDDSSLPSLVNVAQKIMKRS